MIITKKSEITKKEKIIDETSGSIEAFNLKKPIKAKKSNKKAPVKVKKDERKEIKSKQPWLNTFIRIGATFIIVILGLLLFASSGAYAYRDQFEDKAYYGTKLLGEDVGGKTQEEIQILIKNKIDQIEFSFIVDNEVFNVKPSEAGLSFKVEDTSKNAIRRGKSEDWVDGWLYALASLAYKSTPAVTADGSEKYFTENVSMNYLIDQDQLVKFTENLSIKYDTESQNASLMVSGSDVQVVPAVFGRKIVTDSISQQIAEGIKSAVSPKINIEFQKVTPNILESDTAQSVSAAKQLIDIPVRLTYQDKTFTPDKKIVAGWIVFSQQASNGKTIWVPAIDDKLVSKYIFNIGKEINIPAVNRKITIKNGAEQVIDQEGKDGLSVDHAKAAVQVAGKINNGQPVAVELPTYAVAFKTQVNNVLVADWSKYIEVNLSAQTMCAYLAGGVKQNCWAITSGASSKGYATPTGTFLISRKSGAGGAPGSSGGGVCMPNPPSSTPLCGINYVSTFTPQGHAIHEAWWRSPGASNDFGNPNYRYNGSHGCVNATYGAAQWIYGWAPIGTPVVIHY